MSTEGHASIGRAAKNVGSQLRELAEPVERGEKIEVVIDRAAGLAGLDYWRAFNIWYGKARRVEQHETDAVAAALQKKNRQDVRHELHELTTRIALLESRLRQTDPDFYEPDIDRLGAAVRAGRGSTYRRG